MLQLSRRAAGLKASIFDLVDKLNYFINSWLRARLNCFRFPIRFRNGVVFGFQFAPRIVSIWVGRLSWVQVGNVQRFQSIPFGFFRKSVNLRRFGNLFNLAVPNGRKMKFWISVAISTYFSGPGFTRSETFPFRWLRIGYRWCYAVGKFSCRLEERSN